MRIIYTLCAALLVGLWFGAAQADELIGTPYIRTCNGNVHAWVYSRSASGVSAPGRSCAASEPGCISSPAQLAAKAYELLISANPAAAASAALAATAPAYTCDAATTAAQTWQGAVCRERRQFADAHLKDIGITWKWTRVAAEHAPFTLASPNSVRYGAGGTWRQGQLQAGTYSCDNALMGVDPAPGVVKQCDVVEMIDVQEPTCVAPAPVYTHRVKPNGTATDRPASTLVDGVRSAITGFRAKVGQPCDTTKPTAPSTGTDLWARYGPDFPSTLDGKPLVALCERTP